MKTKILCYFALCGFVVSLLVHISTFFINPQEKIQGVMLIHVLCIVVLGLALNTAKKSNLNIVSLAPNTPTWIICLVIISFIYTGINFMIFMALMKNGSPEIVNGSYALTSHGQLIEYVTYKQFQRYQAYEVRGFSGHWMFFFIAAYAVFYVNKIRETVGY
ncbi:hypothetical protein [Inconstantimicrobium mannanitabidum]|uniref:Uncharacterized protein n=1 Tax=Inconstantimicrobium mannanitabidum TaxID=1604901 RepID=A0ACB5RES5_9CLOT|nr:hypothetical protein [Clostridium sp. TW13]GKX67601.1 hypothetical protein rsdtw13_28590 [Clostridium sp. TW13]